MSRESVQTKRRCSRGPAVAGSPFPERGDISQRCSNGAMSPFPQRVDIATRLQPKSAWRQVTALAVAIAVSFVAAAAFAQTAVKVPKPEEKDKVEKAVKKEQEKKAQ